MQENLNLPNVPYVGEKSILHFVWNIKNSLNYSAEKKEELKLQIANKYGVDVDRVKIETNFIATDENGNCEALTASTVRDIVDPVYQINLFKRYIHENKEMLEEQGLDGYDFDLILKIDKDVNEEIGYDKYEKQRRYTIKWIKWDNFLSFGENKFVNFEDLKGLVRLLSKPSNQGGKTNFAFDLIGYALYGADASSKASRLIELFNKFKPDATEVNVECCIESNGGVYFIKRTITRPKKRRKETNTNANSTLNIYKLQNGAELLMDSSEIIANSENITGESITKSENIIKGIIGERDDFDLAIRANSDNLKSLIGLSDSIIGNLLSKWTGLAVISVKKDKVADMYKAKNEEWISFKYNKNILLNQIDDNNGKIEYHKKELVSLNNNLEKIESEIKELEKEIKEISNSKKYINPELENEKWDMLELDKEKIKEEGRIEKEKRKKLREEVESIGEVEDRRNEIKDYDEVINELNKKYGALMSEYKHISIEINNLKNSEYCPTCKRKYENIDNTDIISKKEQEFLDRANEINDIVKIINEKNEIKNKLVQETNDFNKKSNKNCEIDALSINIDAKVEEIEKITKKQSDIIENKEIISHNEKCNAQITAKEAQLSQKNKEKDNIRSLIGSNEGSIRSYNDMNDKTLAILEQIDKEKPEIKSWELYRKMIDKDGIQRMVLKNTIPIINAELKNILDDVCDFDVVIEMNETHGVSFHIITNGAKSNLSTGSGFEQTVAALALRAVLGKISTIPRPSFMLLDEVLGGVSSENYDKVKKLYDKIAKDYDFVFHVTHLNEIEHWHQCSVLITKENNISSVKVLKE